MEPDAEHVQRAIALAALDPQVPERLRRALGGAITAELTSFDETYITFLDEQIELAPRGEAWARLMTRRRAALAPFVDQVMLYVSVPLGHGESATLRFTLDPLRLVYCEVYD